MNNRDYMMGFAVGLVVVIILFVIIWKVNGRAPMKGEYDERQDLIRGRGYKYAFFSVIGLLAVYMIAEGWAGQLPVAGSIVAFAILLVGVMIYAIYCMRNGAFFGIHNNYKSYRIILIAVVLINALSAYLHIRAGEMIVDGQLTLGPTMQVLTTICFAVILIAMEMQLRHDRGEAEIEDSVEDALEEGEEATDEES